MANETLITDLVAQEALDQLEALDRAMAETLDNYTNVAREMAKGLKIPVEVQGDLDKITQVYNTQMRNAAQTTQQLTNIQQQQQQVIANTTNTISRQLAEQEKLNKAQREAYTEQQRGLEIAKGVLGTHEQNVALMARYNKELKDLKDAYKNNAVTAEEYTRRELELKTAKSELQKILNNETKMMQSAEGSYQRLSLQLERMKMAQKQLNEEQKNGAEGKALEKEIQDLDAHLKDMAADMGEFQRNVGNYAIAAQSMKGSVRQLTEEIAQLTLQYESLSDEEKRSDVGMQLRNKITQLTEEAGKYKDIVDDVRQSISASASDTRLFDSLIEAGQVFASTMGLAETACRALGMSEDSLQQSMLKVQQAMQAVQALQVIQNTLQKQSNLMKGIAIVQSKAAAAAARIEAAATASATGATKAQTVAQAAFNLVAKANPYVLLATAILTVIGLIIGYTVATKDATAADEEGNEVREKAIASQKRQAEATRIATDETASRRKAEDEMSDTLASSVSKQLANYVYLQRKWKECGDDVNLQKKFIVDYKTELDNTGFAIKNVHDAHNVLVKQAPNVISMYYALAEAAAAAAVAEDAFKRKIERKTKGTVENGGRYYVAPRRYDELSAEEKDLLVEGDYGIDLLGNPTHLLPSAQKKINEHRENQARELRRSLDAEDDAIINAALKIREEAEKRAQNLQTSIGTAFSSGGSTTSTSGTGGGGKNDPKTQVKEYEEIQAAINKILLDSLKGREDLEVKYSDEWVKTMKASIAKQETVDKDANKKRYEQLLKDLEESHNAKKMTDEQYLTEKQLLEDAYAGIEKNISEERAKREKELDEEVLKHKQELAEKQVEAIAKAAAGEQVLRNKAYQDEVTALYNEYTEALQMAQKKGEDTEKVTEEYDKRKLELDNKYANETVQASIDALEKELKVADLSEEQREELQRQLTETTTQLAQQRAEQEKKFIEDTVKADEEARKKRMQNMQEWVQKSGEAMRDIGELVSSIYDGQIEKIDEQMEVEQAHHDASIAHIDELAEHGIYSTEEAELRKRELEAATAKRTEELEKRKAQLQYRQAVMDKANKVAQIAISTALGIMQTFAQLGWPAGIAGAAFVAAMGAIQTATALAQPIKAYKEGTKGKPHPGGLAVVGDGGQAELVVIGKNAWLTPDRPTLVDLPKGAEVIPGVTQQDVERLGASLPMAITRDKSSGQPVIINDYTALEGRVAANTKAMGKYLSRLERNVTRELKNQSFTAYLSRRL